MGSCLSTSDASPSPWRISSADPTSSPAAKKLRKGGMNSSSSSSSLDSKRAETLRRIPGRMFSNGASAAASIFTQQGKKGTNQDAMIVWENFCSRSDTVFCGVFDGHGPFGHMVARRVRDSLPLRLRSHLENDNGTERSSISTAGSVNSEEASSLNLKEDSRAYVDFKEKEKPSEIFPALKKSFLKAFKVMDKELRAHPNIDCFCSGTTAVTLVKQGQDLVIGNVGDSRAILGTRDQDDCLIAVQLTVDLKPNLPREAERIRRCKGRVFALQDEPDVARVWLPNYNSPGLAMARAFGDFCLKDFGLISVPDISYRRITKRDEFIVLATDGIWDVLSNEEVVSIIASAPVQSYAARSLVEAAVRSWRYKYPTSKIDDCAVVCLFLNSEGSTNGTSKSSLRELHINGSLGSTPADDDTESEPNFPQSLDRSGTVRSSENLGEESVSRIDTLLSLPRFVADTKVKKIE